jgi:hypothetical protein
MTTDPAWSCTDMAATALAAWAMSASVTRPPGGTAAAGACGVGVGGAGATVGVADSGVTGETEVVGFGAATG